ncbi:MAG: NusG domain II-containing protein [Chitinispirillia bacterium]|nr:NusG domain II-containing protein [Chitinispirillia bacterium]MCL2269005.1 NusG domain II-containing protein [Chitinispirillia bacterium]
MRAFGIVDAVIIIALIFCAVYTIPGTMEGQPGRVLVHRQNTVVAEYQVDNDITFTVNGKRGPVDIEIKNGAVRIVHADCPRSVCKLSGGINSPQAQLVCAPNNILVQIRPAGRGKDVDGVAY